MELWAAEEAALSSYRKAQQKWEALETKASISLLDEDDIPLPWEKEGNVGIVKIHGPLVSGTAGWLGALFNVTGYDDIANAVAEAMSDKEVQSLVYHVDSPGGMVSGIDSALDTMRAAKDVLPSYTYADYMASAALWLGSATGNVSAGRLSMVGSVGALIQHADVSKMYEDAGIKITTIRSDPDKANTGPYEPLSDRAKEQLQEHIEDVRDIFVSDLATNYGVSAKTVKNNFGAGRMFLAEDAAERRMVHAVQQFQAVVAKASRIGKRRANKKKA